MSKESEAPNKANFYPKDFVGPEPLLGSDARIPEQSSDIQALQEDVAYLFGCASAWTPTVIGAKDRLKEALTAYAERDAEQKKEIERLKAWLRRLFSTPIGDVPEDTIEDIRDALKSTDGGK